MLHFIPQSRRPLTVLLTSAAVAVAPALAAPTLASPAQAAPPVLTAEAQEPVTPEVDKVTIPDVPRPKQRLLTTQAEPEKAEDSAQPDAQPEERSAQPEAPEDSAHPEESGHIAEGRIVAATGRRDADTFSMVGVTWAASPVDDQVEAEVRVRDADGWTDWQHLHVHNKDIGDRSGTAPLWVGEADGVQARLLSSGTRIAPRDLEIVLIDPGTTAEDEAASPAMASTAAMAQPAAATTAATQATTTQATMSADAPGGVDKPWIISRQAWGADPSLSEPCSHGLYTKTIRTAFVHHTVGSNNYSRSESDNIVRGIYAYHTQGNGWCDIGYNFLVDRYGRIYEGRRGGVWKPVYGAHTGGYNNHSFAVSLMGRFDRGYGEPTWAMMNATVRIIAWKLALNYRYPRGRTWINGKRFDVISGHRDAKSTACPGINVYEDLDWIRNRVAAKIGPYDSRIFNKWKRLGGEDGWVRSPFYGEHATRGGRAAQFNGADIFYKRGPGVHEVHGRIRHRYRRLGGERHFMGFPTSDEKRAGRPGARRSNFQRGRIYWSKGTGAHEVYGRIFRRYAELRGAAGRLGLPTSGEVDAGAPNSRTNRFQYGRIYWSKRTGAHEIQNRMLWRYSRIGGASGRLGLPTTGEVKAGAPKSWTNKFQEGRMYWSKRTGGYETWGDIFDRYRRERGAAGRLGLPTTGNYRVNGGRKQRFEGGAIRWDRSSDTTRVRYY